MIAPSNDKQERFPLWALSGVGFERLNLEARPRPEIGPDQVLARREVCTICYSSVKEILTGNDHPRLRHVNLEKTPIVLGDEAFLVLEKVGENLKDRFEEGAGCSMVPDFGSSAFGYDVPGGLCRYGILEGRLLDYLIPVEAEAVERVGMFGVSLSEPLACCEKSFTLRYRDAPRAGGRMLVVTDGAQDVELALDESWKNAPPLSATVVNAGPRLKNSLLKGFALSEGNFIESNETEPEALRRAHAPEGWDDIVVISHDPRFQAMWVEQGFCTLGKGGVMALLGSAERGTAFELELGTYHYDDTLLVGAAGTDLPAAYRANTNFEQRAGGTTVLLGAGGPMGQLAVLWTLSLGDRAPARVLAVDRNPERLEKIAALKPLAPEGCRLETIDARRRRPGDAAAEVDYLVLMAPAVDALEAWLPHLAEGAVINLFAGLRNKRGRIDAHDICDRRIRLVGHSGDDIPSQRSTLQRIVDGRANLEPVIAAVGGADAAGDALRAAHQGSFPGKIAIYMGCRHELTPVERLTGGGPWTARHERQFIGNHPWSDRT